MQDHGFGLPRILLPRTRVNRQEEGRATTRRLPPTWCEIPVVAIPDKRGILIVVLHQVASTIRAEYNLRCIRRYTTSSLSIAEHLIAKTS